MRTMTLLERGISDGRVSLRGLFDRPELSVPTQEAELKEVIDYTVHGAGLASGTCPLTLRWRSPEDTSKP